MLTNADACLICIPYMAICRNFAAQFEARRLSICQLVNPLIMTSASLPQAQKTKDSALSPSEMNSTSQETPTSTPSADELDDLLLDCRYGELEGVTQFLKTYGVSALADARDERGNTIMHMCAANGHDGAFYFLFDIYPAPFSSFHPTTSFSICKGVKPKLTPNI